MNDTWPSLADHWGAVRVGDRIEHFGAPERERAAVIHGGIISDLGQVAVIRATGAGHRAFLHAQLTSDVSALATHHVQPSAWLTPKGQVLCLMTVLARDDAVELFLPAAQLEAVHKRLAMFVMRAKVQLEDVSGSSTRLGLAGPASDEVVTELLEGIPLGVGQGKNVDGGWVYRLAGAHSRYLVIGEKQSLGTLATTLRNRLALAGHGAWHLACVEAGIPELSEKTQERYIPQMLNLDQLGAVSFDKGCYPGQEIVARTQYLGRLKRRLFKTYVDGPRPDVLSPLTAADDAAVKQGEIVDVAQSTLGRWAVLTVANVERTGSPIEITGPEGPQRLALESVDYGGNANHAPAI